MDILKKLFILHMIVIVSGAENGEMGLQQCKHGDTACVAKLCNVFFEQSAHGIPEFGLVPTNPYEVSNVIVEKGEESPVNIKIQFKRANITGIHTFHINKVIGFDKDPRTSKFEMIGSVKRASIRGPYQISGKFLLLPISGHGHADIIFENVKLRVQLKANVKTKNGKEYISLKKVIINMEPEKLRVNFENLFNNKELSDNLNAVLNENADLFFKELQIPIENILGDAILKIFGPLSESFAYTDIFEIKEGVSGEDLGNKQNFDKTKMSLTYWLKQLLHI